MEQAHEYWMWLKRKQMLIMKSHFQASSWEEKAFAEDAASEVLGGCLWPPRSYSCSFCRREFRSAQALGGHMNVHRRDRARLKQSLSFPLNHNQFSSEVCALEHNSSRVSALRSLENIDSEHDKRLCRVFSISSSSRSKSGEVKKKNSWEDQEDCVCKNDHDHGDCVETNLSVGLNSIICSSERESGCYKRAKISTVSSSLPRLLKPCSSGSEVYEVHRSANEDLDLELRLGDPQN